ncbi:hypothetical protein LSAT2_016870 [Lamellibrachia satsuma]|nr:hypothetical protein LSAT2_016870 [Lamellibrachia satsuma]
MVLDLHSKGPYRGRLETTFLCSQPRLTWDNKFGRLGTDHLWLSRNHLQLCSNNTVDKDHIVAVYRTTKICITRIYLPTGQLERTKLQSSPYSVSLAVVSS